MSKDEMEELKNKLLTLRPATLQDKRSVYNWLAHSNLTREMFGPPNFSDNLIPTWDEFNQDYFDFYFDGSEPLKGRCFILIYNGQQIGQINYNEIDLTRKSTEIDIWLADRKHTGKGYGTEAIRILSNYLNTKFDCDAIYIAPSRRNIIAIKAYKKAGFMETNNIPYNFIPDYDDTVVLINMIKNEKDEKQNTSTQ